MNNVVNIIAIDPGTNNLGLTVMTMNYITMKVVKVNSITITIKNNLLLPDDEENYGSRQAKLNYLTSVVIDAVIKYDAITLVSEGPFYNMRRPGAFAPLVELLQQIKVELYKIRPLVKFVVYEPSTVKQGVGAKGNADKDGVKIALEKLVRDLKIIDMDLLNKMDEHSVDSIAVAMTHYKNLCKTLPDISGGAINV